MKRRTCSRSTHCVLPPCTGTRRHGHPLFIPARVKRDHGRAEASQSALDLGRGMRGEMRARPPAEPPSLDAGPPPTWLARPVDRCAGRLVARSRVVSARVVVRCGGEVPAVPAIGSRR